jgi:hypothetical protein
MLIRLLKWAEVNKVAIALLSLAGSLAGVAFSASDLNSALKEQKKKGAKS